jgi:hypothetical protein
MCKANQSLKTFQPLYICGKNIVPLGGLLSLGFFDLMTHLLIHLIDELEICGPVGARWCYLVERYLNVLNKYVRNRA